MSHTAHRFAALALSCLMLAPTLVSCSLAERVTEEPIPVTVAATTFPASAPVYVAENQGFFEDHGLDAKVRVYNTGAAAMAAAIDGKVDYATVAETPIAQAVVNGQPFSVLATVAQIDSANVIIGRRDKGISAAQDLRGKRVGVVGGTTGDFFLHVFLLVSRVRSEDVTFVELPPDRLVSSLIAGDVDAFSAWAPYTTQATARLGDNAIVLDEPGLYRMSWNIMRPADPKTPRAADERLLAALSDAERYIEENPEGARAIVAEQTRVSDTDLAEQWPDFRWTLQLDQTLIISLEDQGSWMLEKRGEDRQLDFLEHIEAGPLRRVAPMSVNLIESGE